MESSNILRAEIRQILKKYLEESTMRSLNRKYKVGTSFHLKEDNIEENSDEQGTDRILSKLNSKL
jgi:hypothetical protein